VAASASCTFSVSAQSRVGFLAGIGIMRYNGDVGKLRNKIIDPPEVINLYGKIGVSYVLGGHAEATLNFMHGTVEDADSLSDNKDQLVRNQSFKSPVDELSLQLELSLIDLNRAPRVNPYLIVGAGAFRFNPKAELGGSWFELQPLGTEGQNLHESGYASPYSRTAFSFLLGGGLSFRLAPAWRLKLEAAYHLTTTDFLDDVSTAYPDSQLLAATPNGALAVQLSNRRLEPFFPPAGRSRGNPDSKDSFLHIGIVVVFNPGGLGAAGGRRRGGDRCPAFGS